MTATHAAAAHILTQQIYHHLDADLPETANFLAGRLHALEPRSPESAHLLALTYFRLRRYKAAADYAQKHGGHGRHLGCAYVFAQSCLQLNRAGEGVQAMEKSRSIWTAKPPKAHHRFMPDASACWNLLGRLNKIYGDLRRAGECMLEAHQANPFLWEAFEGMCKFGGDLNVQHMFRPPADMIPEGVNTSATAEKDGVYADEVFADPDPFDVLQRKLKLVDQTSTPMADPFAVSVKGGSMVNGRPAAKVPLSEWDTPVANVGNIHEDVNDVAMSGVLVEPDVSQPPPAPARRVRPGQQQFDPPDRPRQPALRGHGVSASEGADDSVGLAQPRRNAATAAVGGHKRTVSGHHTSTTADASGQHPPIRRSNRLFGQGTTSITSRSMNASSRTATSDTSSSLAGDAARPAKPATGTKGRIGSTVGRVVSGNRKVLPPDRNQKDEKVKRAPSRTSERDRGVTTVTTISADQRNAPTKPAIATIPPPNQAQINYNSLVSTLDSLRTLASASYALSRYDTPTALRILRALPASQRETPFVLAQLGKAHYEANDYKSSEEAFARLLKLQPSRTQDIEVYSTVLWHLKKDAPLAFLCHTLRDSGSNTPETWVAVGNAFSLTREHDSAISAFKRAVQVDKNFAYAWTLMGHEYIANEDFDSATLSFRRAVSADRRGYGGWYGLGKCCERMGKLEEAERHYRVASQLNPSNSTLLVCIGLILERLRNKRAALAHYSKALELAPSSALARFKKARVLLHLRHYEEALSELEILRESAPEEANVWFLLGKCYKGLGDRGEGLRCFTCALNLDGKAAPLIKEAMEALDEDDEDQESDDE